jgi:hypothetical protein
MTGRHDATGEGVSGMHRMGDDGDVARRTAPRRALRRSMGTLLLAGAIGVGVLTVIGIAGTAGGPTGVITTLAAASSPHPSSHSSPTARPSATPTPAPLAPPGPPGLGSVLFGCPTPYPTPVPTPTPAPTPAATPTPASTPTPTATPTGGSTPTPRPGATPAPGGGIVSGPYCDPTVATCPGQQQPTTPDSSSLFVPGPATGTTGADTSNAGASTDTSGTSSTDTSNAGAGAATDTSGTSSTDTTGTDAQAPDTGGTPSAAPAGAGGASSGGGTNSNSLFGNQPLPAADATATPAAETTVNIWAIAGAALIVLAVVLSHVVSTVRQRGRKRAASAA